MVAVPRGGGGALAMTDLTPTPGARLSGVQRSGQDSWAPPTGEPLAGTSQERLSEQASAPSLLGAPADADASGAPADAGASAGVSHEEAADCCMSESGDVEEQWYCTECEREIQELPCPHCQGDPAKGKAIYEQDKALANSEWARLRQVMERLSWPAY